MGKTRPPPGSLMHTLVCTKFPFCFLSTQRPLLRTAAHQAIVCSKVERKKLRSVPGASDSEERALLQLDPMSEHSQTPVKP